MLVNQKNYQSIWFEDNKTFIIDQTLLPFSFKVILLDTLDKFIDAIVSMKVRGAPLIGVTAFHAIANEMSLDSSDKSLKATVKKLSATRPTAYNLFWALKEIEDYLLQYPPTQRSEEAYKFVKEKEIEDIKCNQLIGKYCGEFLIDYHKLKKEKIFNIMTHCNAGWLATVDYGTALAPIFYLSELGYNLHIFVSETRPRNQGAFLTAWELDNMNIDHSIISDNASGHLISNGETDCVIVGADRVVHSGEVFNKIGTYMKAISCNENDTPFYVCAPTSTIDWDDKSEGKEIIIENRDDFEVSNIMALDEKNQSVSSGRIASLGSNFRNPAFDMTPRKYISKIFTEKGSADSNSKSLKVHKS